MNLKWKEEGGYYFAFHGCIKLEVWATVDGGWRCCINDGNVRIVYVGPALPTAKAAKKMAEEQLRWYLKGKENEK